MSPNLQIEIARARQREIASRTTTSYDLQDVGPSVDPRPRVRPRVVQVIATLLRASDSQAPSPAVPVRRAAGEMLPWSQR
jgi:hypothetical protein